MVDCSAYCIQQSGTAADIVFVPGHRLDLLNIHPVMDHFAVVINSNSKDALHRECGVRPFHLFDRYRHKICAIYIWAVKQPHFLHLLKGIPERTYCTNGGFYIQHGFANAPPYRHIDPDSVNEKIVPHG